MTRLAVQDALSSIEEEGITAHRAAGLSSVGSGERWIFDREPAQFQRIWAIKKAAPDKVERGHYRNAEFEFGPRFLSEEAGGSIWRFDDTLCWQPDEAPAAPAPTTPTEGGRDA